MLRDQITYYMLPNSYLYFYSICQITSISKTRHFELLRASLPAERSPQAERTHRRHHLPKLSLEKMETERVLGFDDACGLQSPVVLPHALDLQHGTPSVGQARASLGHRQPTRSPAAGQRSSCGAAHRRRTEQATTSHDTRCDTCSGTALARK